MKRNIGVEVSRWRVVVLAALLTTGCAGKRYQEIAVEKSGHVVVMPLKMAWPHIFPGFTQDELKQAANDYSISLRRDIETVLAARLNVAPAEKVERYLKESGLFGTDIDHEDSMDAARKCDGDIVVESYIRLLPVHDKGVFRETRRYDVDAEIRLTDVWNTETLAVFRWQGKRDDFAAQFARLVRGMKVHEAGRKKGR